MKNFFLNFIIIAMIILSAVSCDDINNQKSVSQDIPPQKELVRLARQGLKNINARRVDVGFVEICGDFQDGSKKIKVFTESGNSIKGRLFKDRARFRIAIDRKDFYSEEIIIKKEN